MSDNTKTLISTTVAITKMDRDQLQTVLLDILASNPAVVIKTIDNKDTYKVVVVGGCTNKIGLIKAFRNIHQAGLADSKQWTEGMSYNGCPSGVFAHGMTFEAANDLATAINKEGTAGYTDPSGYVHSPTGVTVQVIRNDANYNYHAAVKWTVDKSGAIN